MDHFPHRSRRPRFRKSPLGHVTVLHCRFHACIRDADLVPFKAALVHAANTCRPGLEALGCDLALFHGRDDQHPNWKAPDELPAGRAVDRQDKAPVLNWLPLVHFRMDRGQPTVTGVGPGARALHLLLLFLGRSLEVAGRAVRVDGWSLDRIGWHMGPAPGGLEYRLLGYAFLKEHQDEKDGTDSPKRTSDRDIYLGLRSERERRRFIADKLCSHIVALYNELGEDPGLEVEVEILGSSTQDREPGVDGPRSGLVRDLHVRANVHLPPGAALGVGTRMGRGRILEA